MEKNEYETLAAQRDMLVKQLKKARLGSYRVRLNEQLTTIRERIKNAHREQWNRGRNNPIR